MKKNALRSIKKILLGGKGRLTVGLTAEKQMSNFSWSKGDLVCALMQAEHLNSHYSSKNGFIFQYKGTNLSGNQLCITVQYKSNTDYKIISIESYRAKQFLTGSQNNLV